MPAGLHNGRVLGSKAAVVALLLMAGPLLAGCSDDDKGPDIGESTSPSTTESTTAAAAPSEPPLPVPAGVELTEQGSQLAVGDTATVAYEPRQGVVGVLDITVTRLEKTSFRKSFVGWQLDETQKQANPYFVRATITNRGDTDLGGRRAPLYIVDGKNVLVEPTTFASAFTACEPGEFPQNYPAGKKVKVCLVFLSPAKGDLTAVSFRPSQENDPITWTGTLEKPKPPKPGKGNNGPDAEPTETP